MCILTTRKGRTIYFISTSNMVKCVHLTEFSPFRCQHTSKKVPPGKFPSGTMN